MRERLVVGFGREIRSDLRRKIMTADTTDLGLSVIVPAHNSDKTLEKCLWALQSSDYRPLEIILVDDASTDRTCHIARQFGVKLVSLENNVGQGSAKNAAADAAKGDILVFVDADIVVAKDTLRIIADCFRQNPGTGAVTGRLDGNAPIKGFLSRYKNRYMEYVFSRLPNRVDFIFTSIAAIRSTVFLPFAGARMKADDTELGFRLSGNGATVVFCPELKVQHLKEYSFTSFIRNEFRIPYDWAQIFLSRRGLRRLIEKRRFAHAQFSQIFGLFVASATAVFLIGYALGSLSPLFPAVVLATTLGLNYRFLRYITKHEGIRFALAGAAVTFIDPIVMSVGIAAGSAVFILKFFSKCLFH